VEEEDAARPKRLLLRSQTVSMACTEMDISRFLDVGRALNTYLLCPSFEERGGVCVESLHE
jgi:hypothetical protein